MKPPGLGASATVDPGEGTSSQPHWPSRARSIEKRAKWS
ncbi:hypothetical protein SCE1572_45055 [Sorangium cellulosum So0157-2]|uniref:Uncharacterized protein n=1 Tax=Sorangium cellulosum So0157-2 TaxID=1254432 RepID=S4Y9N9_SORCE|nr:hypothetical protein SCE1572_45055 [Sorangium cellulosum So0157-2]